MYKEEILAKVKDLNAYYDFPVFCALSVSLNQIEEENYAFLRRDLSRVNSAKEYYNP